MEPGAAIGLPWASPGVCPGNLGGSLRTYPSASSEKGAPATSPNLGVSPQPHKATRVPRLAGEPHECGAVLLSPIQLTPGWSPRAPAAVCLGGCPVQQKPLWVEHRHRSRRPLPSLTQKGPKTPLRRMPSLPGGPSLAPPPESQGSELRIQKIQPRQCRREAAGPLGEGRTSGRGPGREASQWCPFLIRQMRDLT